ncbi:M48 family metalloprotease [Polynucleobacter paneuropaeus]|nr:M48 family metalloprotease [Polynucleobacter paneuropaeus]
MQIRLLNLCFFFAALFIVYGNALAACKLVAQKQLNSFFEAGLQGICNRLSINEDSGKDFVLLISDKDSEINAYAYEKDGHSIIYITEPLLKAHSFDPRLLVFVMGHEMAHHSLGHVSETSLTKFLDRVKLAISATYGADAMGYGNLAKFSLKSIDNHFSRVQELDADKLSLSLMLKAGYQKKDALDSLNTLLSFSNDSHFKSFFNNHPDTQFRISNLEKY